MTSKAILPSVQASTSRACRRRSRTRWRAATATEQTSSRTSPSTTKVSSPTTWSSTRAFKLRFLELIKQCFEEYNPLLLSQSVNECSLPSPKRCSLNSITNKSYQLSPQMAQKIHHVQPTYLTWFETGEWNRNVLFMFSDALQCWH